MPHPPAGTSEAPFTDTSSSPANAGRVLLALSELRKVYPSVDRKANDLVVLDSLSFDIHEGEFVAFLGPSGCGKSTLLQIVAGLLEPSAGRACLDEVPITEPPEGMVYLFQQYAKSLFPWRTVIGNVAFPLEADSRMDSAQRTQRCKELLGLVGLSGFERHFPWQLSGGMQQRVAIARALAASPRILLLDEPFSAVDALTRVELQMLLLNIWEREKLTVLLVTHDVDEAVFMSDRIAVLSRQPTRIEHVFPTGLPRPRDSIATREDERFLLLRRKLLNLLLNTAKD